MGFGPELPNVDHIAQRLFPMLPDWLHATSSIASVYAVMIAIAIVMAVYGVVTLEFIVSSSVRQRYSPLGMVWLASMDVSLGFLGHYLVAV